MYRPPLREFNLEFCKVLALKKPRAMPIIIIIIISIRTKSTNTEKNN